MPEDSSIETINKTLEKSSLSVKEQVEYVKKTFKTEGLLLTLEMKRISKTQASMHGVLYDMNKDGSDDAFMEGLLIYTIQDSNFKEQEIVLAFNLGGDENLVDKIKNFFKDNSTTAFTQVANLLTSIGLKFIH